MDAIVGLFGSLFDKFLVMLIPREDYCHPFDRRRALREDGDLLRRAASASRSG